mmetsp:Transcript_18701/g.29154  ORF Transcript_18701/g.29154 Transcript_18701/m.29154 type:complete len:142 (+) Transcript_18701:197-622(+)|eukprot:CAMPEP_0184305086 /NCGR_PEP_ID=MMETSP1049-20130417/14450_1 /TAXON_ID=77928 /ORGANISM="Proteomonas sulcata, Strain CCMP704" /LENGTH=141 /DNA_ID=CAMNT_0026617073 /DNA_START=190 /DNA_END=615 /DNA_ORIENTATION=+
MSSFDLERQGEAKQDVCAACSAEIHPGSGQPVVYAMDQKFCSEGCRCVWFFKQEQDGVCCSPESDVDMMKHYMVGKKSCECPCLNHDGDCPHFASYSAGLVKNKWGFNKFILKEDESCTARRDDSFKEIRLCPMRESELQG